MVRFSRLGDLLLVAGLVGLKLLLDLNSLIVLCSFSHPSNYGFHFCVQDWSTTYAKEGYKLKFCGKQQQQEQQGDVVRKQRPQTLDSLFANMKEQGIRALLRQTNAFQRNGGGQQRMPSGRGRFGN
ncbi:uncharacterized protein [Gossypium hirsutum]|uniref:Uncharacterized protein n=1 Tax=Gossypium hirsutum TaxID=3635 RepID=A0ABM3BV70_GOSHI|nr:uncharacterized protein LOC121230371 [Gossypium hirsutum]